ncbi:hypothetical protein R75461_07308 [Paraburkholderia nemoris]|uniref:hypothetical protein n=1 Tax=Paraburkholderia nemoris TaxID=2793076 RepID=UPI00190CD56E|nr:MULTISPECIES: hypothetical protein [Paraburkholderia]MBK3786040.1 hypothetical protein [Paraburkholderia aspalathi]CAE6847343.1 hypothetical protein R75461_07308 [Paraburkholderia nemoris]
MTRVGLFETHWQSRPIAFGRSNEPVRKTGESLTDRASVGGPVCNAVYRVAHEWAYSRFVTSVAAVSHHGDAVAVELCHTWRITRTANGALDFARWAPLEQTWQNVAASALPDLPLFGSGGRPELAKRLIDDACTWYVNAAGEALRLSMSDFMREACGFDSAIRLAADVLKQDRVRHKIRFEPLSSAGAVAGAALWSLIDRDHLKAVCRIHSRPMVQDYAVVAAHDAGVRRVSDEHPNLLPLLREIPPTQWNDPNLFAHYRWKEATIAPVRTGRRAIAAVIHERSTLRIAKANDGWVVAENRSHCNAAPHAVLNSIRPRVASAYTTAERESSHGQEG